MKEIKCNIIKDILPLYADDVVSDDTKEMVEEHLKQCEDCKREMDFIKKEIYIPAENKTRVIENFKKKFRNKKLIISALSILFTGLILFGSFFLVFHFERAIPYDESLIKIEEDGDMLISHYSGESFYGTYEAGPLQLEIDGEEKNIVFLYYTKTISDSSKRSWFKGKNTREEFDFTFPLDKKANIDAIYYTKFESAIDRFNIRDDSEDLDLYWKELMESGDLIWRR